MKKTIIIILLVLTSVLTSVFSQTTYESEATIPYYANLKDANGNAVNGLLIIKFALYNVDVEGYPLWSETRQVNVRGGEFEVALGSKTPLKLPFDEQYWLGITIEEGEEMFPRKMLGIVPIAIAKRAAMPIGSIIMWSGTTLPKGWALCNGETQITALGDTIITPDLRGRFVVGWDLEDGDYNAIGEKGGETAHTLTVAEMPEHTHDMDHSHRGSATTGNNTGIQDWGASRGYPTNYADKIGDDPSNYVGTAGHGGSIFKFKNTTHTNHTHDISINTNNWALTTPADNNNTGSTGGTTPHENRPPYYTLAYIIKL